MVAARKFIPASCVLLLLALCTLSDAWTTFSRAQCPPAARRGTELKAISTALHFQTGSDHQENELDTSIRLQIALEAARDADRRYGLCTPASSAAWQLVDDIFSSSQASREVEKNVKRVLGEKSIWSSFEQR